LNAAASSAAQKIIGSGGFGGFFAPRRNDGPPPPPRVGFGPTMDGRIINCRSFSEIGPDVSKNVPVIFGNVSEEGMRFSQNPSEAEWRAQQVEAWGEERGNQIVDAMKAAHPEKAIRTLSYGLGGLATRNRMQDMVRLKHEQHGAPVYQYLFQWQSPQLDGVCGAWHTAELAFCFDNTQRCEQGTGDTQEARVLATKMSTAWANFARTGNPSQPGLRWAPSDPTHCQTMVFDNQCRMENDPEGALRRLLLS
jgi:para-nitrobenzyl esterase